MSARKQQGIRSQVAWLTLVPPLVMALGLESFFLHERFAELDRSLLTRGQLLASQLAVSSEYGVFSANRAFLQSIATGVLQEADVRAVAILHADGRVLATAGEGLLTLGADGKTRLQRVNVQTPLFDDGRELLLYQTIWSVPVELDEGAAQPPTRQEGAVVLAMSRDHTRHRKQESLLLSLSVTALFLLLTLGLARLASRRIIEPIRQLSEAIRAIGAGQLDTRCAVSGEIRELGEVAHGLNNMAEHVQSKNIELNQRLDYETRLSAVAFESHDCLIITDADGVIVRVNRAFSDVTGYSAEEALGQTPHMLQSGLHGDGFYAGMWDKLLRTGRWQGEIWDKRKNGEIFPCWLSITAIRRSDGGVRHYLASYIDITSRKRVEKRLADTLAFNETVLEQSPYGIAVYQDDGLCVMANQAYAATLDTTVDALLQQNFRLADAGRHNGLCDCVERVLSQRSKVRCNVEGATAQGKAVVLECVASHLVIADKSHILLMVKDITDRVRAERALSESNQQLERKELAKTRFLAAAGHDLRQPLTAANMFIYALKGSTLDRQQADIVRQLEHSMRTFGGLLDALLHVSRLDAGRIKPVQGALPVFDLLSALEQDFSPMIHDKGLGFKLYFPMKEPLVLYSDPGLVKSVLMNLVSNAIKFTAAGGVMVSVRRRGNRALIQVWDTGSGIPSAALEYIFDEFYQVGNPQRDRTSGLGLGLSIVRRTLELLGSEISCHSRLGCGSVFAFQLPLAPASLPALPFAVRQETLAHVPFSVRGARFMVVEDDLLVAQATQSCLEGMGALVRVCHQAELALEQAAMEAFDYYLVDYMLGGKMDGIQFLNQLAARSTVPVKAVLMTGDTSTRFILNSEQFAWPVLYKPVSVPEMLARLQQQS